MELGFTSRLKSWLILTDSAGAVVDEASNTVTVARQKSSNSTAYAFDAVFCGERGRADIDDSLMGVGQLVTGVGLQSTCLLLLGDYSSSQCNLSAIQTVLEALDLSSGVVKRIELSCYQAYDTTVIDLLAPDNSLRRSKGTDGLSVKSFNALEEGVKGSVMVAIRLAAAKRDIIQEHSFSSSHPPTTTLHTVGFCSTFFASVSFVASSDARSSLEFTSLPSVDVLSWSKAATLPSSSCSIVPQWAEGNLHEAERLDAPAREKAATVAVQSCQKGIAALARCSAALVSVAASSSSSPDRGQQQQHVPYRDALLTRLLRRSLSGPVALHLVTHLASADEASAHTLRLASLMGGVTTFVWVPSYSHFVSPSLSSSAFAASSSGAGADAGQRDRGQVSPPFMLVEPEAAAGSVAYSGADARFEASCAALRGELGDIRSILRRMMLAYRPFAPSPSPSASGNPQQGGQRQGQEQEQEQEQGLERSLELLSELVQRVGPPRARQLLALGLVPTGATATPAAAAAAAAAAGGSAVSESGKEGEELEQGQGQEQEQGRRAIDAETLPSLVSPPATPRPSSKQQQQQQQQRRNGSDGGLSLPSIPPSLRSPRSTRSTPRGRQEQEQEQELEQGQDRGREQEEFIRAAWNGKAIPLPLRDLSAGPDPLFALCPALHPEAYADADGKTPDMQPSALTTDEGGAEKKAKKELFASPVRLLSPAELASLQSGLPDIAPSSPSSPSSQAGSSPASMRERARLRKENQTYGSAAPEEEAAGSGLSDGEREFLWKVALGDVEAVELMLSKRLVSIVVRNAFGRDAMQIAARNGNVPLLSLLQSWGGEMSSRGPRGDTLMHLSAANGHTTAMRWLQTNGALVEAVNMLGQSPVHIAARRGELKALELLNSWGVDMANEDFDGCTAFESIPRSGAYNDNQEELDACRAFLIRVGAVGVNIPAENASG